MSKCMQAHPGSLIRGPLPRTSNQCARHHHAPCILRRCMGHEAREADSQPPPGTLRRRSVLLSTTAAGLAVVGLAGQTLPSLAGAPSGPLVATLGHAGGLLSVLRDAPLTCAPPAQKRAQAQP